MRANCVQVARGRAPAPRVVRVRLRRHVRVRRRDHRRIHSLPKGREAVGNVDALVVDGLLAALLGGERGAARHLLVDVVEHHRHHEGEADVRGDEQQEDAREPAENVGDRLERREAGLGEEEEEEAHVRPEAHGRHVAGRLLRRDEDDRVDDGDALQRQPHREDRAAERGAHPAPPRLERRGGEEVRVRQELEHGAEVEREVRQPRQVDLAAVGGGARLLSRHPRPARAADDRGRAAPERPLGERHDDEQPEHPAPPLVELLERHVHLAPPLRVEGARARHHRPAAHRVLDVPRRERRRAHRAEFAARRADGSGVGVGAYELRRLRT